MSPTEEFTDTLYRAVFCAAMSWRISRVLWSTLPKPKVRIITELFNCKFMSLIVWKMGLRSSSSEGAPSVRNRMTRFFGFAVVSAAMDAFKRLNAF